MFCLPPGGRKNEDIDIFKDVFSRDDIAYIIYDKNKYTCKDEW